MEFKMNREQYARDLLQHMKIDQPEKYMELKRLPKSKDMIYTHTINFSELASIENEAQDILEYIVERGKRYWDRVHVQAKWLKIYCESIRLCAIPWNHKVDIKFRVIFETNKDRDEVKRLKKQIVATQYKIEALKNDYDKFADCGSKLGTFPEYQASEMNLYTKQLSDLERQLKRLEQELYHKNPVCRVDLDDHNDRLIANDLEPMGFSK